MSYQRLVECLLKRRPYFGPALRSLQGPPSRHKYFRPVVQAVAGPNRLLSILEIGSWAGASAISWAAALMDVQSPGRVLCVDPWRPYFDPEIEQERHYREMTEAARNELIYELFKHNIACSGYGNQIDYSRGESSDILPTLTDQSFDIIYIDGAHSFTAVVFDIRHAKRLIKHGGIICGDDLEAQLHELNADEATAAPNESHDYVSSNSLGISYHPGVTAAVAAEFGPVAVWEGFWAVQLAANGYTQPILDMTGARLPDYIARAAAQPEGETQHYVCRSLQNRYFAFSKQLPLSTLEQLADCDDLPPLIYIGDTLDEVRNKALQQPQPPTASEAPIDASVPQLIEHYRGFNLVLFHRNIWGLREALGSVDVTRGEDLLLAQYGEENVVVNSSAAIVKARIDCIELRLDLRVVSRRLQAYDDAIDELRRTQAALAAERRDESAGRLVQPSAIEALRGELSALAAMTHSQHSSTVEALQEIRNQIDRNREDSLDRYQTLEQSFNRVQSFADNLQVITVQQYASLTDELEIRMNQSIESLRVRENELERQLQSLHQKIQELRYGPQGQRAPYLVELYRGFRIFRSADKVYAIRSNASNGQSLLADSLPEAEHNGENALVASSEDSMRARIDALLAEMAIREMAAQLQASLGKPVNLTCLDE